MAQKKNVDQTSGWRGRQDKTRQDRQDSKQRTRAVEAQDRVRWMKETKPSCSRHWTYYVH